MGNSIRLLTVRGIDIRVHVTFPLILIFAILQFGVFTDQGVAGAIFGIIVTLLLFAIVVLHELSHSVAAQHYGVPVTQIVLLPIGSVAQFERIPENPGQELVIAIAGPLVNFVIAVGLYLIMMYPKNRTVKWRENQWIEKRYEKHIQSRIQSESGT